MRCPICKRPPNDITLSPGQAACECEPKPEGAITHTLWKKAIQRLDGRAVVNLEEPSEGDLARVFAAYCKECDEHDAMKAELSVLRAQLATAEKKNHYNCIGVIAEFKDKWQTCERELTKERDRSEQLKIAVDKATDIIAKERSKSAALVEAAKLGLSFAPKGPVPEGLAPMFYHTLNYQDELKLQARIDEAREALERWEE